MAPNSYDTSERCDKLDNNCDGVVDEGCSCNYLGKTQGVCAKGKLDSSGKCLPPATYQASDICSDNLDNDCDGVVNEDCPCNYLGKTQGVCALAVSDSQGICLKPSFYNTVDSCDGKDNDCDGAVDEDFSGKGTPCTLANLQGECAISKWSCSAGKKACIQTVFPVKETCNNKDDDCDGKVDNAKTSTGSACLYCGNKKVEAGEQCDDGNTIGGDGCSRYCRKEIPLLFDKNTWGGAMWSGNVLRGTWFPSYVSGTKDLARFYLNDTSWGQIRSTFLLKQGNAVRFDIYPILSSGGINHDSAYVGFGDKWIFYEGSFVGLEFSAGQIWLVQFPSVGRIKSIGNYTKSTWTSVWMKLGTNNVLEIQSSNNQPFSYKVSGLTSYILMIATKDSSDGHHIKNLAYTK